MINSINECLISNSVFQINVLTACRASNLDMSNISSITNKCIFNDIVENTHVVNPVIDPVVAPVVVVPVVAPVVAPPSKKPIPKNNNTLLIIISISIVFSIIIFSIIFFLVLRKYS